MTSVGPMSYPGVAKNTKLQLAEVRLKTRVSGDLD